MLNEQRQKNRTKKGCLCLKGPGLLTVKLLLRMGETKQDWVANNLGKCSEA